ncbi:hypothetical protein [Rubrivivax benzoatilyticus]|uniref:Lipoprotein n=1 Tax=Rubrivivax benzoatilyticus TaxID=316997 RepID=A0ABX0HXF3_9BURK|nr:hypothetical protein [Rubrivivax benzoatilyticus]EGJ10320.1 putative lipoprotein [Rubrivivax benzoatilyticus JA2 = ATCC BAA-35]NHK98487.1 hypothetical protein [Rubrivivax benzoatilyticus]NHL23738.1 hypothetical protein [Rubrivivax benzoatilyticus]
MPRLNTAHSLTPFTLAAALAAALALAACGERTPPDPMPAAQARQGAKAADASAEEVAREMRGNLRCPAPAPASPPPGTPVDDVLGVRPGQPWDEAVRRVLCSEPLLVMAPDLANRFRLPPSEPAVRQGFHARPAEARVHKSGQQILREMQADATARGNNAVRAGLAPGLSRWYVGTMGLPGEERVTHLVREQAFAADALPATDGVIQALLGKYGEPSWTQDLRRRADHSLGSVELRWVHDPAGRRVAAGERLATECSIVPTVDAGVGLSEACGLVVVATIRTARENPGLAQAMGVGIVDQARGYARVAATEQALQQRDAERRQREVQDAARKGQAPKL